METMGIVQARTPEGVKNEAINILDKLGLNMSTYINMALNQLIIQEGIPFSVKLTKPSYTDEEKIKEVVATMRMEGLQLNDDDLGMLRSIERGDMSYDEARTKILRCSMSDTRYCYPNSDVLINKLNIREQDKLYAFERRLTMLRLLELMDNPICGQFDFRHLKEIHAYIFQDIYDWAGKVRTVDIAKGNMFCNVRFIPEQAEEIFSKLKKEKYLAGLEEDVLIRKLAYYFSEINALHPFREGNGRSQREFIRSLALKNGYVIHFDRISESEMVLASQKSFLCDYSDMEKLFSKCITKK